MIGSWPAAAESNTSYVGVSACDAADAGDQASSNSRSAVAPETAAINCCWETGRAIIDATDSTGNPSPSASSTDTADGPDGAIRARTDDAPAACSDTPCQENGSDISAPPAPECVTAAACSAASSSTGCTPNPVTPPAACGSVTSAKNSSPRRHSAVNPWNAGPYW